jgi:hypothetical protein
MPAGFLYVLTHPSDPNLYKVGMSTRHPEERLIEHNSRYEEHAGKIVKETGQNWELKTFIAVPDVYWAESTFWGYTGLSDIPYRFGVEIAQLNWKTVEGGLKAADKAGMRPPPGPIADHVYAYGAWMKKRLKGRGITLIGHVRSKCSGRSDFLCDNGHKWRTTPNDVAEGEGCPECGMGERAYSEIQQSLNIGVACLLTNPNKPGIVKFGITNSPVGLCTNVGFWGDWEVQRSLNVEEPRLAEKLIWDLFEQPQTADGELEIDLKQAEQTWKQLHHRLVSEIALIEKAKEASENEKPLETKNVEQLSLLEI